MRERSGESEMLSKKFVTALAAGVLVVTAGVADAQNRQQGQGQGQGQGQQQSGARQRQMERAADQDRAMDHQRMQDRERDRTQVHKDQAKASGNGAQGIYGGNLMTVEERNQYREQLGAAKTDEEREALIARHREEMQVRSRQQDRAIEVTDE